MRVPKWVLAVGTCAVVTGVVLAISIALLLVFVLNQQRESSANAAQVRMVPTRVLVATPRPRATATPQPVVPVPRRLENCNGQIFFGYGLVPGQPASVYNASLQTMEDVFVVAARVDGTTATIVVGDVPACTMVFAPAPDNPAGINRGQYALLNERDVNGNYATTMECFHWETQENTVAFLCA